MSNQEPIAWSCWNEDMPSAIITFIEPDKYGWQSIKPLYEHPPQYRELSDEEIEEVKLPKTKKEAEAMLLVAMNYLGIADNKPHPKCDESCMYLCQVSKLTDTEIIELGGQFFNQSDWDAVGFYEAILKKAVEK